MLADFKGVRWDILAQLFSKYCGSFYGSQTWDLRTEHVQGLYRSWNRAVCIVLQLPFDSHHYLLPLLLGTPSLEVQFMCRFDKLCQTMYNSPNKSVSFIIQNCILNGDSLIGRNLFYICSRYKCNVYTVLKKRVNIIKMEVNEGQLMNAEFVKELFSARDGVMNIDGVNIDEIKDIIDYVTAN
jgi:hypothetical protein